MAKLTIQSNYIFKISYPKIIEALKSCLCAMDRVEELRLCEIPRLKLEEIFRDLPKSAPQLHTLRIEVKGRSFHFVGPASPIYEDFLYDTERLRCVVLTNCKISWESQLLTGLTRLTLQNSSTANSSIIQFLHALQRMPALTYLYLERSIPDDSEHSSTFPIVDLPCLQKLHISSRVGPLTTVLRHITIPHSAKFSLVCRGKRSTQIDFSNFLSVFASKFLSSWIILGLTLRLFDDTDDTQTDGLEFYLWTTVFKSFPPSPSCIRFRSRPHLVLTWPSSLRENRNHAKVLTYVFKAIRFPYLFQLQIATENYIDSRTWLRTFGTLLLLRWMCVRSNKPHSFLKALVYKKEAGDKWETISFPNLRYVHLECTDFFGAARDSISVDMLLDCLRERCERYAEIRCLGLRDCYYISSDDVKRLKEVVVDVIWDGKEQELSDEDDEDESDGDTIEDSEEESDEDSDDD